ncbi:colicin immunity protein Cui [Salmonella enterica subsp. enterica serovar Teko]
MLNLKKKELDANKIVCLFMAIGMLPLMLLLVLYLYHPHSSLFDFILRSSLDMSLTYSTKNLLLSKSMGFYCKLAPLFALLVFITFRGNFKFKFPEVNWKTFRVLLEFTILYFVLIYFLLMYNYDIDDSHRFIDFFSLNDYLLTSFYLLSYSISYLFTVYYVGFVFVVFKAIFRRPD